ncbi:Choline transporter-like [Trema orientale]|uniref:Choline transporter-like n=1 Tax=Trema orientale TaxID=63057 RepID=A0A2P5BRE5_TREOI|nr:Choline transporter-like [Trema orientale]
MLVIRNILLASISRVKYMHVACEADIKPGLAFCDMLKHLIGSICIGSFLVPILGVMWVSARSIKLLKGPKIEFMCSCANCYTGRIGLEELIDSDRTGSFCFLSRVAVGAI